MSDQCAHMPCVCPIDPERLAQGAKYCCDLCATEPEGEACPCGHQGCSHEVESTSDHQTSVITLGEQYNRG